MLMQVASKHSCAQLAACDASNVGEIWAVRAGEPAWAVSARLPERETGREERRQRQESDRNGDRERHDRGRQRVGVIQGIWVRMLLLLLKAYCRHWAISNLSVVLAIHDQGSQNKVSSSGVVSTMGVWLS